MSTQINNHGSEKGGRTSSFTKKLLSASAASTFVLMAYTPAAQAQVPVIDVTTCADVAGNPGIDDAGAIVRIDTGTTCTTSSGDNILLDSGSLNEEGQDNVTINIFSGTTLANTDSSDEDTVIFIDNAENNTSINVHEGATLRGANGVLFLEGDGTTINNNGDIIGTGAQEEGVIYIDRDTDSDLISISNGATGRIIAEDNGPAIAIELLLADGEDDAEHVGVQSALADFPTVTILNRGIIETTGTVSDDNDAINIAGNPGTTGGFSRACIETTDSTGAAVATPALNCIVNLQVINTGTIQSNFDNSGVAAITVEDDALVDGRITNLSGGTITGTVNGIRIADIVVGSETAEHNLVIANQGTISGTGTSSRGLDLEGDGVTVVNRTGGTISGLSTGISVGAGSSNGVDNSGVNNTIHNQGTISGGSFSIDSNEAEGRVRVVARGGAVFIGDIRGSVGNIDQLVIREGTTSLEVDVLQDYNVFVDTTGNLTLVGDREIQGQLQSAGTVTLDVADTLTVERDVILRAGSTVEVSDLTGIGAIGAQYTLINVGGVLTNNASISDTSALLDFSFVASSDLVVEANAAASSVSKITFNSASTQAFGGTVLSAFADGGLDNTTAFTALGSLSTFAEVGSTIESLAPDLSGNLVENVFNSIQGNAGLIDQRLNDLNCNAVGGSDQTCSTFAETGAWVQVSDTSSTQGSLSSLSTPAFNSAAGANSRTFTYGYDHALEDSTVVGFSGTYIQNNVDEESETNSFTDLEVAQVSAYAGHQFGNVDLVSQASYTYAEANTRRQSFEAIRSELDVNGLNLQGTASYNADIGAGYYAKPHVGLQYSDVTTSAFTENGGLNLNIDETNTSVLEGRVGLTLGARKAVSDTTRADYYVTAAVRNDFYGERSDLGYAFAGQTGSLAVTNEGSYGVQGLAGLNILSGKNFSFGGAVNAELSDQENSVGGSVQTKIRW